MYPRRTPGLLAAAALLLAACSTAAQPMAGPDTVVVTIGDTRVTLAEVDQLAMRQEADTFGSMTLEQAIYESRRAVIDQIVARRLYEAEAAARGIDTAELVRQEIEDKVIPPTDGEVVDWYNANPQRVRGATLEQVGDAIAELLLRERRARAERAFVNTLRATTPVTITLEPPRIEVADAGRPARGPADAPVTIIEFSDFQCPFCLQATATVHRVLSTYGDRIRFVYRHFPLPNHPDAIPAAEASLCAAEQDGFWPFHDRLFASQNDLSADGLRRHAAALGLDMTAFNACFDTRKYRGEVEADMAAGREAGVTGTPAFFINGRLVGGAQPFEAFERIIEEELARR